MKAGTLIAAALFATASLAANAVGRLADISILDRSTGRELPVYWHEGRPYVAGNPCGVDSHTVSRRRRTAAVSKRATGQT